MIYKDITFEDYLKLDGINASKLKPYSISPKRGLYKENKKFNRSMAMSLGSLVHAHVLEGQKAAQELIDSKYITSGFPINESTGKAYSETSKKYQEWIAKQDPSKEVIFPEILENTVSKVVRAISGHKPSVNTLKQCSYREVAITWVCQYTGAKCKALVDFFGENIAGDLKTFGQEMTQHSLKREIATRQYHLQFAFYRDGLIKNNINIDEFRVIFAKTSEDYDVGCFIVNDESLNQGQDDYIKAIGNYMIAHNSKDIKGCFPDLGYIGIPNSYLENDDEADDEEKKIIAKLLEA